MSKLEKLIDTLKDLEVVHSKFRVRVQLSDFDIEDKSIVAHLLMDWCTSTEEMKHLLDEFLIQFLAKFKTDKDETIR